MQRCTPPAALWRSSWVILSAVDPSRSHPSRRGSEEDNVGTCHYSPGTSIADSMMPMSRQITKLTTGHTRGRLSPCVCNTLRMVSRVVTQLYDDCLRPSGLRVTQFSILATVARLGEASLKQP